MAIYKQRNLFFIFLIFAACNQQQKENNVVARAGSSILSVEDFTTYYLHNEREGLSEDKKRERLTHWVNTEVLYLRAVEANLDKDGFLSFNSDKYYKELLANAYLDMYLSKNVSVSSEEIRDYYNKHRESFKRETEEVLLTHLLFPDEQSAVNAQITLSSYDKTLGSAPIPINEYNVSTNLVSGETVLPQLKNHIFKNKSFLGIVGPIKTEYGFHIINILDRFPAGSYIGVDNLYDEITQRISEQKRRHLYLKLTDSLKTVYNSFINIDLLKEEM